MFYDRAVKTGSETLMRLSRLLLAMLGFLACSCCCPSRCRNACAEPPGIGEIPANVHAHPRLIANDDDLARVKKLIADDPIPRAWAPLLIADADKVLTEPPPAYDAARGIEVARNYLYRITNL